MDDPKEIPAMRQQFKGLTEDSLRLGFSIEDSTKALFNNVSALGTGAVSTEAFAAAQDTVDLGVTMVANLSYRIAIVLIPNVSVDFYVNEVYRGQITAQVPSGPAAGTCYWVLSMDNAAQAVACVLRCSPISYWNHL